MRYGKKKVLCSTKASIAAAIVIITLVLGACATRRPALDSWGDASLVAEQRLIIEQQQQRLNDMGEAIGRVQSGLERAIDTVTASINGTTDLASKFSGIDRFVRAVIESKRELEDIQQRDSGADAGTR